jgi:hypothetical protein
MSFPYPGAVSYNPQTNAAGNSTVAPQSQVHTEFINFTGGAGDYGAILTNPGLSVGARVNVQCAFPATAGLLISIYNLSDGVPLAEFTTDGIVLSALFSYVFDGTNFQPVLSAIPAI